MQKLFRFLLAFCFISICSINILSAQYCVPGTVYIPSYNSYNFYIDRVRLGDIDNQDLTTPDITSYDDYTQYGGRTLLTRGFSNTMTINAGPTIYFNSMYYAAWIDYNNDNDFLDAGEKLGEYKTIIQNEQFTITFTVPSTALVSTARLRVRCVYAVSNINPCTTYNYGEAEDYMVSIADFQKTATSIANISGGEMAFFNYA